MTDKKPTNPLALETSPYLLQHAHNPVHWYPWSDAALSLARDQDKPILVSIGYSACHWCHVMEQESFHNEATAAVMNELFICIKVDREERPDLDKIYQTSHQLLMQRPGGWPLNMFLTPDDHVPFFGGTYFPPEPRYGMPAFTDILRNVADYYHNKKADIDAQNQQLKRYLNSLGDSAQRGVISDAPLFAARKQYAQQFDRVNAGFGQAPKFPQPTNLERCLRHWARARLNDATDSEALAIFQQTLDAMAAGGLYDQIGGGFYRYSVDAEWTIPHFEKMLYDNAQLLPLYAEAALATGNGHYRSIARETAQWIMREMQAAEGGYYSTLDADSEGEEGRFYVWTRKEVQSFLSDDEWQVVSPYYGLSSTPNFEGKWHLNIATDVALDKEQGRLLSQAKEKMFARRRQRVRPDCDDKVLTAWNGLMIYGMARAGRLLDEPQFIDSAAQALDFIRSRLWRRQRLLVTSRDGKEQLNAYLDDYVFLAHGILEFLQARWRDGDLTFVIELVDTVLAHFEDKARGGFYFTSDDHETLVYRPKPGSDDAMPSGNGIAVQVLLKLGHLLGESRYLDAASRTLKAMANEMEQSPSACGALLTGLEEYLNPGQSIVIRGSVAAMAPWLDRCRQHYAPGRFYLAIPEEAGNLPGVLAERKADGDVVAYICSGLTCSPPVTGFTELDQALKPLEVPATSSSPAGV